MFGGWGPHLGHLVQAEGDLYWVDDLCQQEVAGDCDVKRNRRVGVFRFGGAGWSRLATIPLPAGVQQNTAALALPGRLSVFGLDVQQRRVVECSYRLQTGETGCATIPIDLGVNANYIGAALSPEGYRLVWWTNVVEGGVGSFSYIVDYSGGWNGPRRGPVGGYHMCGYAHAGFQPASRAFTFFCQAVSGLPPDWQFTAVVGRADLSTTLAPAWSVALAPAAEDVAATTNDMFVDTISGRTHLIARMRSGAAAYYTRAAPEDGFEGPTLVEPAAFRARLLVSDLYAAWIAGPGEGGLVLRVVRSASLSDAVDWLSAATRVLPLPPDFGMVVGIYPLAAVYQADPVTRLDFAVVGAGAENQVLHIRLIAE